MWRIFKKFCVFERILSRYISLCERYVGNLNVLIFFDIGRMNLEADRSMSSRAFCRCNSVAKAYILLYDLYST